MDTKKNKTIRIDAPGDNWPVLDLRLLAAARKESLLVAQLRIRKPRWRLLRGGRR